jgi:hypothetical protein
VLLENSSLHTNVPEAMFREKVCVATELLSSGGAVARALTVRLEATRKGAKYFGEEVVGVVPSVV